jgi:MYXO-CTERM domain-containing protein
MTTTLLAILLLGGAAQADGDIINGEAPSADHHPEAGGMLAGAVIDFGGSTFDLKMLMCSSTLIAPDVVLLAAHCVDFEYYEQMAGMQFDNVDIAFSRTADLSGYAGMPGTDWPADSVFAWDVAAHPEFSMQAIQMGLAENFDIALMFLDEAVLDVAPALLPTEAEATALVEGAVVEIVGWGQQTSDQTPPAGTVGIKMAGTSVVGDIAAHEFQVGVAEDDVRKCHGDSGGPSYLDVGGTGNSKRLVGVTSHAYDQTDCRETGGVDTRVDYYLEWIDAEMRSRCEDGTRVWCETEGIVPSDFSPEGFVFEETEDEVEGCSCSTAPPPMSLVWAFGLLGLVSRRRR